MTNMRQKFQENKYKIKNTLLDNPKNINMNILIQKYIIPHRFKLM